MRSDVDARVVSIKRGPGKTPEPRSEGARGRGSEETLTKRPPRCSAQTDEQKEKGSLSSEAQRREFQSVVQHRPRAGSQRQLARAGSAAEAMRYRQQGPVDEDARSQTRPQSESEGQGARMSISSAMKDEPRKGRRRDSRPEGGRGKQSVSCLESHQSQKSPPV